MTGRGETEPLIDLLASLLELKEALAEVEVPEVASCLWVNVFLRRVTVIDTLVILQLRLWVHI